MLALAWPRRSEFGARREEWACPAEPVSLEAWAERNARNRSPATAQLDVVKSCGHIVFFTGEFNLPGGGADDFAKFRNRNRRRDFGAWFRDCNIMIEPMPVPVEPGKLLCEWREEAAFEVAIVSGGSRATAPQEHPLIPAPEVVARVAGAGSASQSTGADLPVP